MPIPRLHSLLLAATMSVTAANGANAANAAAQPPTGQPASKAGCAAPEYRQFDFWLGDWDAFEADDPKTVIARTHVDLVAAGCAVHELYEQTDGLIGDSILSFDAVRKAWQQTWVTNFGSLMVISGRLVDGALTLEGETHSGRGKSLRQLITWKREGDDVRESSTISKDDGQTWEPAFDVVFRRHR